MKNKTTNIQNMYYSINGMFYFAYKFFFFQKRLKQTVKIPKDGNARASGTLEEQ